MHVRKENKYKLFLIHVRYLKHHSLIEIEALICKIKQTKKNVVELDQNSNDIRSLFNEYTKIVLTKYTKKNKKQKRTDQPCTLNKY